MYHYRRARGGPLASDPAILSARSVHCRAASEKVKLYCIMEKVYEYVHSKLFVNRDC